MSYKHLGLSFSLFFLLQNLAFAQALRAKSVPTTSGLKRIVVQRDVPMRDYLQYMDSLVATYDTSAIYPLTAHLLVRANPFVITALENTDYYRQKERGVFVANQQDVVVLKKGDRLTIPPPSVIAELTAEMAQTRLDVNIPEYKLRVIVGTDTTYTFPIRVGKNTDKFLSEAGRERDLRTRTGVGKIIDVYMNSTIIEPTESKKVTTTLRDDGKRTKMPLQPWIETEINGERLGQLIHPTTNPKTLGAPSSNGCIGTREADIWRIFYYAPMGTPITVRYDLEAVNETGKPQKLRDIYHREKSHDLRVEDY